jgi:hypothetical protein
MEQASKSKAGREHRSRSTRPLAISIVSLLATFGFAYLLVRSHDTVPSTYKLLDWLGVFLVPKSGATLLVALVCLVVALAHKDRSPAELSFVLMGRWSRLEKLCAHRALALAS